MPTGRVLTQRRVRIESASAAAAAFRGAARGFGGPAATAAWGFGCPAAAPATTAHGAVREVYTIVEAKGEDILSMLTLTK